MCVRVVVVVVGGGCRWGGGVGTVGKWVAGR